MANPVERTQALIEHLRANVQAARAAGVTTMMARVNLDVAEKSEWYTLFGILTAPAAIRECFDVIALASRCDELVQAALKSTRAESP